MPAFAGHDDPKARLETRNLKRIALSDLRPRRFGRQQNIHQLSECRVSFFVYFFDLYRSDRMLHDQYGMIRRTERLFLRFRQRVEGVGNQSDRKAAALLNLN
jgi:hypothetical protein